MVFIILSVSFSRFKLHYNIYEVFAFVTNKRHTNMDYICISRICSHPCSSMCIRLPYIYGPFTCKAQITYKSIIYNTINIFPRFGCRPLYNITFGAHNSFMSHHIRLILHAGSEINVLSYRALSVSKKYAIFWQFLSFIADFWTSYNFLHGANILLHKIALWFEHLKWSRICFKIGSILFLTE